jgi:hypothetical protein
MSLVEQELPTLPEHPSSDNIQRVAVRGNSEITPNSASEDERMTDRNLWLANRMIT